MQYSAALFQLSNLHQHWITSNIIFLERKNEFKDLFPLKLSTSLFKVLITEKRKLLVFIVNIIKLNESENISYLALWKRTVFC
mgnify:FL=1